MTALCLASSLRRSAIVMMAVLPGLTLACTPRSEADAPMNGVDTLAMSEQAGEAVPADEYDTVRTAPLPDVDARRIAFGSVRYRTTFTVDGKERGVTTRRVVERATENGEAIVRVRQTTESTDSGGEDVIDLAADSLQPIRRRFLQPTNSAEIDYGSDLVRGVIKIAEREIPVRIELDAPSFGDGGALETAILAMPLAEDFRARLRSVEAGVRPRVRYWSLEVAGREAIDVPAGRFTTLRVELEPLDDMGGGQTLWASHETPRLVIQLENRLPPDLGGAVTVTTLIDGP